MTAMTAITRNARPSAGYADKLAASRALLERAAAEFQPLKQACSLGAEDTVVTHLIERLGLDIPVFVLDTGALHPETLAMAQRLRERSRLRVEIWQPEAVQVVQFVERNGADAMRRSVDLRKQCCDIRKLQPLQRALEGQRAWITGLRREQSPDRADVPQVDASATRIKFNPLADWTWGDVWHYIATEGVEYHPLHDAFYPSIGCAPCTRAIAAGEDFRAGRWWWEGGDTPKECGLHGRPAAGASPQIAASAQADFGNAEVKAPPGAGRSQSTHPTTPKECGLHGRPAAGASPQIAASAQADFGNAEVKAPPGAGRSQSTHPTTPKECGLHGRPAAGASPQIAASAQADFGNAEVKAPPGAGRSLSEPARDTDPTLEETA